MSTDLIRLNVGGVVYDTTRTTLVRNPFFAILLSDDSRWTGGQIDGRYFIDRSGIAFDHVLNLLRSGNYEFPEEYVEELEFFMIGSDKVTLRPSTTTIMERLDELESTMTKLFAAQKIYTQCFEENCNSPVFDEFDYCLKHGEWEYKHWGTFSMGTVVQGPQDTMRKIAKNLGGSPSMALTDVWSRQSGWVGDPDPIPHRDLHLGKLVRRQVHSSDDE